MIYITDNTYGYQLLATGQFTVNFMKSCLTFCLVLNLLEITIRLLSKITFLTSTLAFILLPLVGLYCNRCCVCKNFIFQNLLSVFRYCELGGLLSTTAHAFFLGFMPDIFFIQISSWCIEKNNGLWRFTLHF